MKVSILIPTYNESLNIETLLTQISKVSKKCSQVNFDIFVIDDSSPDNTGSVVKKIGQELQTINFNVSLLVRKTKEGLGKAYIFGFNHILESGKVTDYILQMDADLSHQPKYIEDFILAAEKGAEFVVGSRYIKGGSIPNWSWYRRFISKVGNFYARLILGVRISDYTGGYNLYSMALLRRIDFSKIHTKGYGFLISLKNQACLISNNTKQVPIEFLDRQHGESKMPLSTILDNFLLVLKIKLTNIFGL